MIFATCCHQILLYFFSGDLPLASCCIHSNEALAWRELTYQCHLQHVLPSLATESTDLEDLEVTAVVTGYSTERNMQRPGRRIANRPGLSLSPLDSSLKMISKTG